MRLEMEMDNGLYVYLTLGRWDLGKDRVFLKAFLIYMKNPSKKSVICYALSKSLYKHPGSNLLQWGKHKKSPVSVTTWAVLLASSGLYQLQILSPVKTTDTLK